MHAFDVRTVIKLGRYTQKQRMDNLTECQQLQLQFPSTSETSNTQQSEQAYDDDDPQIEDFISIIMQVHQNHPPNITNHTQQVTCCIIIKKIYYLIAEFGPLLLFPWW